MVKKMLLSLVFFTLISLCITIYFILYKVINNEPLALLETTTQQNHNKKIESKSKQIDSDKESSGNSSELKGGTKINNLETIQKDVDGTNKQENSDSSISMDSFSGTIIFMNDYKPEYYETQGFTYYGEAPNGEYITNIYGAPLAEIIVKNESGKIVGKFFSNQDGTFNFDVNKQKYYDVEVRYNGRSTENNIFQSGATKDIKVTLGRFIN